MGDIIIELIKAITETKRFRFVKLLISFFMAVILLVVFERYSASIRLTRLQKEADLLSRIKEIQARGTNNTVDVERTQNALVAHMARLVEERHLALEFSPTRLLSMESLWKFFAGCSIWWALAVLRLRKITTRDGRDERYFFIAMGGIFGLFSLFVPALWWPWFHMLVLPWLISASLLLPAAMSFVVIMNWRAAKATALRNRCINNLRQLDGATEQWALEFNKPDQAVPTVSDLAPYLKGAIFPRCPLGGVYKLSSSTGTPTCSIPNHKL